MLLRHFGWGALLHWGLLKWIKALIQTWWQLKEIHDGQKGPCLLLGEASSQRRRLTVKAVGGCSLRPGGGLNSDPCIVGSHNATTNPGLLLRLLLGLLLGRLLLGMALTIIIRMSVTRHCLIPPSAIEAE